MADGDAAAAAGPAAAAPAEPRKTWIPLESNPQVITAFARRLGMPRAYAFHDVFGLNEDLLGIVPGPVLALLLLFPITPATEAHAERTDAALAAAGAAAAPEGVFYMKQTVGNACGTIAMLHAIANSRDAMGLGGEGEGEGEGEGDGGDKKETSGGGSAKDERSFLRRFLSATASLSPAERGAFLEAPPAGAPDLEAAHRRAAERGDTAAPGAEDDVDLHFVALVPVGGRVWELDGRRRGPVDHGPCDGGGAGDGAGSSFLAEAARVAKEFIAREEAAGGSIAFNLIALGPADEDEDEEEEEEA